jgi:mRNA interferase YafQ
MKKVKTTGRFRKDFKRFLNQPAKLRKLYSIVDILRYGGIVPKENYPHLLSGNYAGYMECHIENDFLLIWLDANEDTIKLIRLGSHSDLF